jgi:hypothetical protein
MSIRQSGRSGVIFSVVSLLGNAEINLSAAFFYFSAETGMFRFLI